MPRLTPRRAALAFTLALLVFGFGVVLADDPPPDPDPCFPPDTPEPDGDCLQAITDLINHGGTDDKWDSRAENFKVESGATDCTLTIDGTGFTVWGYWTEDGSPTGGRTCGLTNATQSLDIADGGSSWKVGWSVPDSVWQATVRLNGNGLLAEGSTDP